MRTPTAACVRELSGFVGTPGSAHSHVGGIFANRMRRACFAADITLQDARDAIHGRTEFREHPFADHVIFSYYLGQAADDAMFPDPDKAPSDALRRQWLVRRECRGLVFCSSTGALLSRRLHKAMRVSSGKRAERDTDTSRTVL